MRSEPGIPGLQLVRSGKVRELYQVGHDRLLLVASDRISAFDVVLGEPVPDKGRVLTALSSHWFDLTRQLVPNHVVSADPTDFPETTPAAFSGRATLVKAARVVPMECVVRGYLFGSAYSEYEAQGTVNWVRLAPGLRQAEELPEPIFTPTTKAEVGHDEALSAEAAVALVGEDRYEALRELSVAVYRFGAARCASAGFILADTKFEFGELDGELLLIDELLTPDSSRLWSIEEYKPGTSPPSFDKQFVRDYLDSVGWDRRPPPPRLPKEIVEGTRARYVEAYEQLTGASFDAWHGEEP
ncbi:MAG: phosphoribosylaminoimidazolesuccinocarboxamide synthase [Acidimicrobiia bacterium]